MRSGRVVVSAGAMTHAQYKTHHGVRASTHFHAHLRVYIAGTRSRDPSRVLLALSSATSDFLLLRVDARTAIHFVEAPRLPNGDRPPTQRRRQFWGSESAGT